MKTKQEKSDKDLDLSDREAISKLQELIKHNSICMFVTHLGDVPLETRPMSVAEIDDDGYFWFLSGKSTKKNLDISDDPNVQLFFANTSDQEYLTVYGEATEINDNKEKMKDLWNPIAKAWFPEGVDDPDLSLLKIEPLDAYYWDTKNGKMISMIKILASAVTGKTMEEGVRGKLKV